MKEKTFQTADLYLTSAISLLLGIQPDFKIENGRVLFSFPVSDDLHKSMNAYIRGIPLNAIEFASTIKRIRGEMIVRRNMEVRGT